MNENPREREKLQEIEMKRLEIVSNEKLIMRALAQLLIKSEIPLNRTKLVCLTKILIERSK